jgi:hypothetical protein
LGAGFDYGADDEADEASDDRSDDRDKENLASEPAAMLAQRQESLRHKQGFKQRRNDG